MFELAAYAVRQERSACSREYPENKHPLRNPFQRDRDRIVHSKAFRRLEYKTQVFVNHLGDNFRTRLTHSIEVSQIARSVARVLRLNEDLTETVALAHDLGHPPFGHAGERAIHRLMRGHGGFDHNEQTLRIVTQLEERYPEFPGLNLTQATRQGLQKHKQLPMGESHSLEAQVVDICDEIAYNNHDLDDGLDSGLLTLEDLKKVEIWRECWENTARRLTGASTKIKIRHSIRSLIDQMVTDLVEQTKKNIDRLGIKTLEDVLNIHHQDAERRKIVCFSKNFAEKSLELKRFLSQYLYKHPEVEKMNREAEKTIRRIFSSLIERQDALPEEYQRRIPDTGLYTSVCDFIAGMTDRYAINWK